MVVKCWVLGLNHHPNQHLVQNNLTNVYCIPMLNLPSNGEISGTLQCQSVLFSSLDPRLRPRHLKDFVFAYHQGVVVGKLGFPIFEVPTSLSLIPSPKLQCLPVSEPLPPLPWHSCSTHCLVLTSRITRNTVDMCHVESFSTKFSSWCLGQLLVSSRGAVKPTTAVRPA